MKSSTSKHMNPILLTATILILLLSACANSGSPSAPPSAETKATATIPACELKCTVVKQQPKESLDVKFYSITGESTAAVEGLQLDLTCENGQAVQKGERVSELEGFAMVVIVNEERTYTDTNQIYKIDGSLKYDMGNVEKLGAYSFTVSGGKFSEPQTCKAP